MTIKLLFYAFSFLISTFVVSGINFKNFFKENHIWEARFFIVILIISLSYILTSFLYDILVMITYSL